ncbi:unnamed protein product [Symbiodinium sp. CCMP2592]|nr:unnamed protein product [Symbiodinium sp. CCMP2592]
MGARGRHVGYNKPASVKLFAVHCLLGAALIGASTYQTHLLSFARLHFAGCYPARGCRKLGAVRVSAAGMNHTSQEFDDEALEALFGNDIKLTYGFTSQPRQSPWKAKKKGRSARAKKPWAIPKKTMPKKKPKCKTVRQHKHQDKKQRAMVQQEEANEKILARQKPKRRRIVTYHLPGGIRASGVGSNIRKATRNAACELINILERPLLSPEEFQSKRTLETNLTYKIDKARKRYCWTGKDFHDRDLPHDLGEAFREQGLQNAFVLAWLSLEEKPAERQDEIDLMRRVWNVSVENGYMPRRQDFTGWRRFIAFGQGVCDYLQYADKKRSDLTKAAAIVQKLMKDAKETSAEEARDMRIRLQACCDQFCRLTARSRIWDETGYEPGTPARRKHDALLIKEADELRPRVNYARIVLPMIKFCVGREIGKNYGLEFRGSGRTRTDIHGSDMDLFIFDESLGGPVSEVMLRKLRKCLQKRIEAYNTYGTVLPNRPRPLQNFQDKTPHPKPRARRLALTTSPRGSALRILAQSPANHNWFERYDILRCRPAELLPDFLQERCYNTRGPCQDLAHMQECEWFRGRPGLQRGVRFTRYYCSNQYKGDDGAREMAIKHVYLRRLVYEISVEEGFEPPCLDRTGILTLLKFCERSGSRLDRAFGAIANCSTPQSPRD